MNKRQQKKRLKKMLCEHGKFMCFACLVDGPADSGYTFTRLADVVRIQEFKSPGRVVKFDPRFIMDNATEPAQL